MCSKEISLVILCLALCVNSFGFAMDLRNNDGFMTDLDLDYYDDGGRSFEMKTFNLSQANGLFNFSTGNLLGIGAGIILAIILFEIALYALDVYYNKTYGFGGSSSSYGSGGYQRRKDETFNSEIYQEYPKYQDPFASTYRSLASTTRLDKILEWIALGQETYELGSETVKDFSCRKKIICELYQYEMGNLSARARHGLDLLDLLNYIDLPDDLTDEMDEYQDAKKIPKHFDSCETAYPDCHFSVKHLKDVYDQI